MEPDDPRDEESGGPPPPTEPRRKSSVEKCVFSNSMVSPELMLTNCINSSQDLTTLEHSKRLTLKAALPQIFVSLCATSFHLALGVCLAYTATLIPQLRAEDSDIPTTETESAWIASIFVIVVPFSSFFAGISMEKFGRITTIKISTLPAIASSVMIALATNVHYIIAGRFIMGFATAFGINPATVYITEITSPELRGALVSSGPTISSLGMMVGYLTGALLPWRTVSWINVGYCILPLVLTVLFVRESPVWLVSKGRIEEARTVLQRLAKWEDPATKDKDVERRLRTLMKDHEDKLKEAAEAGTSSGCSKVVSGLRKPTGYKPLVILVFLFTFQQFTGCYITLFYAVQFFQEAGSSMNAYNASVMVGAVRFIMSALTTFLLSRCGRRPLCMISCVGMAVSMAVSGYFTRQYLSDHQPTLVPVICILLYVCFCMIGLLNLPWTMAAELFPTEIRGYGHGIVVSAAHVVMFLAVQMYYHMVEALGGHDGLQWFFAATSLVGLIFCYFFLPETHNKTLFEIEEYFKHNTVYTKSKSGKNQLSVPTVVTIPEERVYRKASIRTRLESLREETTDEIKLEHNPLFDASSIEFIDKSTYNLDK